MSDPSLHALALGTLLPAFPGTQPPDWALRLVERGLAGFALFGANIVDADQLLAVTRRLREVRPDLVLATDEEGGDVTRLGYRQGSAYPGNAALGAVDDLALTRAIHHAIGLDLARLGLTLDMAPAADVNAVDDNPAIGTRSFGADASRVAAHTAAAVLGLQSAGVAACAKHFPGHGATGLDSHLGLPVIDAPRSVLQARELPPFVAAIEAGVRAIMTAHIRVPALGGDEPATFSRPILVDLLRTELGFTGVVVSDALEMHGASQHIGIPEAAVRALVAGNDLLCFGGELPKSARAEQVVMATAEAVVTAVADGRVSPQRLATSARRAASLAVRSPSTGPAPDAGLGLVAARRAVRVEGALPSGMSTGTVIQLEPPATLAVGEVPWGLAPVLPGVEKVRDAGTTPQAAADALAARCAGRPVVLVSRDTHRHPWFRDLVELLSKRHPQVVLVEMGWPASWRPAGVAAYLATYGAARPNAYAAAELLGLPAA